MAPLCETLLKGLLGGVLQTSRLPALGYLSHVKPQRLFSASPWVSMLS